MIVIDIHPFQHSHLEHVTRSTMHAVINQLLMNTTKPVLIRGNSSTHPYVPRIIHLSLHVRPSPNPTFYPPFFAKIFLQSLKCP